MQNRSSWFILIPLSLFLFYDFIQLYMMNSISHVLIQEIQISPYQMGLISSLFFYANLVTLFFSGALLDTYSPKWVITASIAVTLIGLLIFAIHQSTLTAIIWRLTSGIAGGFGYLSVAKVLSDKFPSHRLGLLFGLTGWVIMPAAIVAQTPLLILLQHIGLANTIWINISFGLLIILATITLIDNYQPTHKIKFSFNLKQSLLKINHWLIALYAAVTNIPLFVLGAVWGNLYLTHLHKITLADASLVTSMLFAGNMIGAPLFGSISDKLNERQRLMVFNSLLFTLVISGILLINSNLTWLLATLFFLLGITTGGQTLAYASMADLNKKENTAKSTSLISFLSVGGGAIVQDLFGVLIKSSHNELGGYHVGMSFLLAAALLAIITSSLLTLRIRARLKISQAYN